MSILRIVNNVTAVCGLDQTPSLFANLTDRTKVELLVLANEMAQRIAWDMRDWTMLRKSVTFTGDGVKDAFDLPPDFKRLLTNSHVWRSTSVVTPMRFIPDTDEWNQRRVANYAAPWGEWTIFGGRIHVMPILGAGATIRFSYLDKNCVNLSASAPPNNLGEQFLADDDTFRLNERLLRTGMIWQWKANKGSPYAEDMGTWSDAMAVAMGADSPSPIIIGRLPSSVYAKDAYPFNIPDGMVPL